MQRIHHTLAIGAAAQVFASTITYPYQVVKARLQQGGPAAERYRGTWDCFRQIMQKEGVRGYYKGLSANILKVVPSGSVTFAAYEEIYQQLSRWD
jgi:solute carrier family 25 folate transporter 32